MAPEYITVLLNFINCYSKWHAGVQGRTKLYDFIPYFLSTNKHTYEQRFTEACFFLNKMEYVVSFDVHEVRVNFSAEASVLFVECDRKPIRWIINAFEMSHIAPLAFQVDVVACSRQLLAQHSTDDYAT